MWSKHSRRIDPINRSATPFCQGEADAVGLSRMPMARNRRVTMAPWIRSRSRMRYRGASSHGKASVIWCAIHPAVGFVVTLIQTRSLRSSRMMTKA